MSGTREFVSLHERMSVLTDHSHDLFDKTKLHANAPEKIIPDLVSGFTTIPPREMDRVRRINRSELLTLDVTHPPTYLRCRMLEAFPCPPEISLTEEQSEELNTEVATFNGIMGNVLVDKYLPRL
ncbi:MAG: hypothetical protein GY789_24300 [Hyphomicrobiales bacterium]|nr:hypothetical protein [Hyphomicrobiales bacterium]